MTDLCVAHTAAAATHPITPLLCAFLVVVVPLLLIVVVEVVIGFLDSL